MDLIIEPSACKSSKDEAGVETPASFKGKVTIKLPTMPESYRFKAKYGRRAMSLDGKDVSDKTMITLELIADIAEEIKDSLVKIELEEISTKKKLASMDDLYSYEPAFGIVAEISMKFIQGFAEKN